MKIKKWTFENGLSSPQAAFRMYDSSVKKKPKHNNLNTDAEVSHAAKAPRHNLRCRVKSQLKSLLKLLEQKVDVCVENES